MHSDTAHSPSRRPAAGVFLLGRRSSGALAAAHGHGANDNDTGSAGREREDVAANRDDATCCERLAGDDDVGDGWLVEDGCCCERGGF